MKNSGEISIEIGGKTRLIKFGLGSTRAVCDFHNIKLSELDARFGIDDLFLEEIYGGLIHALNLIDETADFNRAQVLDWIDALPQTDLQAIFNTWLTTSQHGETRYEKFVKLISQLNGVKGEKKKPNG